MKLRAEKTNPSVDPEWSHFIKDYDIRSGVVVAAIVRDIIFKEEQQALADLFAAAPGTAEKLIVVRGELATAETNLVLKSDSLAFAKKELDRVDALNTRITAMKDQVVHEHDAMFKRLGKSEALNAEMRKNVEVISRQLKELVNRLKSKLGSEHADYISKEVASDWCGDLAKKALNIIEKDKEG